MRHHEPGTRARNSGAQSRASLARHGLAALGMAAFAIAFCLHHRWFLRRFTGQLGPTWLLVPSMETHGLVVVSLGALPRSVERPTGAEAALPVLPKTLTWMMR
jgi:hypothetical protein